MTALIVLLIAQTIPAPDEFKEVLEHVVKGIKDGLAPSVALAVVRDGKVVWAEGFGLTDLERKSAATPDSIYLLASVSKPLTATGLMILVERGKINLDRPASVYLGEAKLRAHAGSADEMTVRRLANHTAGLPLHWNFFYDGVRPPSMDETIRRYGFAARAPGRDWGYSNLAYGILGHITERAAGVPWREFMDREVYDAIGMKRTSDRVRPGLEKDAAAPYDADAAGRFVRVAPYEFDHPGASAMWSTANDLARFVILHLNDGAGVLKPETAREMRRQTVTRPEGGGTGVGWAVTSYFGTPGFGHSGGMPGVSTLVACYPETKSATIVLTNTSRRTMTNELSKRLAAVLFPQAKPSNVNVTEAAGKADDFAGTWKGKLHHFEGDIPLTLVVRSDGTVRVELGRDGSNLRSVKFRGPGLTGEMDGLLKTQAGFHGTPLLRFDLHRDGNRMTGVCMAQATGYFCLSHWVELERRQSGD